MASEHRDHDPTREDWSALMARAQAGDQGAYQRLLRGVVPAIRAEAARYHRAPDRIEDVVQETLLTVHRARHTYDPARPFAPWLVAIARRRAIDALRRRGRTDAAEISDPLAYETFADPAANREVARSDQTAGLGAAIASLPAGQREAVELLKLKELSLAEAAQTSGKSVAALKVNVHRAIKALRGKLTGEG